MTRTRRDYKAYLLRLWRDKQEAPWRASLENPNSGERMAFATLVELIAFIEEMIGERIRPLSSEPASAHLTRSRTMADQSLLPYIVAPGEAAVYGSLKGEKTHILLSGKETGSAFALILDETPPGGGPPLHIHRNEDETFYILEGTLTVQVNDERLTLTPGTTAFLPRGIPHTFANLGTETVKFVGVVTPAGPEDFFAAVAPLTSEAEPDMAAIMALAAQYHIELVGPPLAADHQS